MINRQNIFKLALAMTLIVVSYLVFSKPNYNINTIAHFDKIGHIGSFFVLSYLTYFAFKPRWYLLACVLAFYAVFIEIVQSQLSYRSASVADFIADMIGILLFYITQWLYSKYFKAAKIIDNSTG
ncbi:VanZ family protein [Shewanella sp. KX20019]|uniref:VanZ family protein n=1 Tax=Shewanella sp. KX20019 TaxID=2803864 RepID=UPI0019256E8B|nr:VanZ family protein [Shewanella sp. KX20019]QQX82598.1 VanZ family protein [Shewanella sp. KX20019]